MWSWLKPKVTVEEKKDVLPEKIANIEKFIRSMLINKDQWVNYQDDIITLASDSSQSLTKNPDAIDFFTIRMLFSLAKH